MCTAFCLTGSQHAAESGGLGRPRPLRVPLSPSCVCYPLPSFQCLIKSSELLQRKRSGQIRRERGRWADTSPIIISIFLVRLFASAHLAASVGSWQGSWRAAERVQTRSSSQPRRAPGEGKCSRTSCSQ